MLDLITSISWQFLLFILIALIWSVSIIYLDKKGVLKRFNMDRIWFIALMWRTKKGTQLIDKIASFRSFWMKVSTVGFVFFFTGMIFMFILVALSAFVALTSPLVKPVGAEEVLVLPGINPYVPFVYGLIGLIIAVVAHEFSHGIIARVMDFKVKALGLLFIIIPMGAFMEPDEEEVDKGPRIARMRMFAAGPIMNFILAFLFIGMFSWGMMSSLEAEDDPLIITDISTRSAAHLSFEDVPKAIYSINGTDINSYRDLREYNGSVPGDWIMVEVKMNGDRDIVPMISGLMIIGVGKDTPADDSDIIEGSIIYSLNGTIVNSSEQFSDMMDDTVKGQTITLRLLVPSLNDDNDILDPISPPSELLDDPEIYDGIKDYPSYSMVTYNVTLEDKYEYYNMKQFEGKGYIGVTSTYLGVSGIGSEVFIDRLARPIYSEKTFAGKVANVVYLTFQLPLETDKMPFHDPLTDIYDVKGPISIMPEPLFWFIANTMFYTFWLNILLGLFNALPMVPLDGGFVFRDSMVLIIRKFFAFGRKHSPFFKEYFTDTSDERLDKMAKRISVTASFLVLGLILLSIMGPRIQQLI